MTPSENVSFRKSFASSIRRNAVALISLAVALFGTSYNTWRNQTTEAHRNTRTASFMLLDALGQLQEITDRRFYGGDHSDANRIEGWGKVSVVRDMAALVSPETDQDAKSLFETWKSHSDELDSGDKPAEEAIAKAIAATRGQVLQDLHELL